MRFVLLIMWKWFLFRLTNISQFLRKPFVGPNSYAHLFRGNKGEDSGLFKKYRLNRGFTNYLLDGNGVIIAKNISAADLSAYVKEIG